MPLKIRNHGEDSCLFFTSFCFLGCSFVLFCFVLALLLDKIKIWQFSVGRKVFRSKILELLLESHLRHMEGKSKHNVSLTLRKTGKDLELLSNFCLG